MTAFASHERLKCHECHGDLHKQIAGISAERDALNVRLSAIQIDQAVYRKLPGRVCVRARPRTSRRGTERHGP